MTPPPPHLLYVYPWMPYPRRVLIYLREHSIPTSIVTVVPVSNPGAGDKAADEFPPRPLGSLPILAIPPPSPSTPVSAAAAGDGIPSSLEGWKLLGQSLSIIQYLDETIIRKSSNGMVEEGRDPFMAACANGYIVAGEGAMACWNSVRNFGSGVGVASIPLVVKESLKWVHRELAVVERHLDPESGNDGEGGGYKKRLTLGGGDGGMGPSTGDLVLLSFLELVDDLYCCFDEVTLGKEGGGKDAYGREVQRLGYYPHIREFYRLFRERPSASREAGVGEAVIPAMREKAGKWIDGAFED